MTFVQQPAMPHGAVNTSPCRSASSRAPFRFAAAECLRHDVVWQTGVRSKPAQTRRVQPAGLAWVKRASCALIATAAVTVSATAGNAEPARRGSIQFLQQSPLFTTTNAADHLNFPFVGRFDDGTMWLFYTQGRHLLAPETHFVKISTNNGQTWASAAHPISPSNVHEFAPGTGPLNAVGQEMRVVSVSFASSPTFSNRQTLYLNRWISPRSPNQPLPGGSGRELEFPFPVRNLTAHRSMIELAPGELLQSLYGQKQGDTKERAMLIRSTDKGETWHYHSTIGYTDATSEGFAEPDLIQLSDGSLLAMLRTGGGSEIWQTRSTDGGRTWTDAHPVSAKFGTVDPHLLRTRNGTLLATAGRPTGQYLLVDYTGTGNHWEEHTILAPTHPGSGYASLIEYELNKVMLFYTWSGFWKTDLPTNELPNRIMVTRFSVTVARP